MNTARMNKYLAQMNTLVKNGGACDATCQKQKRINRAKTAMVNAQNAMRNAPINLESAQKAYYSESKGYPFYARMLLNKKKAVANKTVKSWNESYLNNDFAKLDTQVNYYKSQYIYKKNINAVADAWSTKNKNLSDKVEQTTAKKRVDDRLAYFYDYNTSVVNSVIFYLKIFYWILVITCVILFFWKRQYTSFKFYPFIISVLLLPFILSKIYVFVMNRFRFFVINNIYLIFFTIIIFLMWLFEYISYLPFSS